MIITEQSLHSSVRVLFFVLQKLLPNQIEAYEYDEIFGETSGKWDCAIGVFPRNLVDGSDINGNDIKGNDDVDGNGVDGNGVNGNRVNGNGVNGTSVGGNGSDGKGGRTTGEERNKVVASDAVAEEGAENDADQDGTVTLIFDALHAAHEVWVRSGGRVTNAMVEWPGGICSGPVWLSLLLERKRWSITDDLGEDVGRFVLAMHLVTQWRKTGLFEFLDPKRNAQVRCTELEGLRNIEELRAFNLSFEEVALFSCLASSRLFHEWAINSNKCHVLMKRWFDALFRIIWDTDSRWEDEYFGLELKSINNERERKKERKRLLRDVRTKDIRPSRQTRASPETGQGDEKVRDVLKDRAFQTWLDVPALPRLPPAAFERFFSALNACNFWRYRPVQITRMDGFQELRKISLRTATSNAVVPSAMPPSAVEEVGSVVSQARHLKGLVPENLYDLRFSCRDFSKQYARLKLKAILETDDMSIFSNPFTATLYWSLCERHFALSWSLLKIMKTLDSERTWRSVASEYLLPIAKYTMPESVPLDMTVEEFFQMYRWSRTHALEKPWSESTQDLGVYRNPKISNNYSKLIHLAASCCRVTNKHRNQAGLADFGSYGHDYEGLWEPAAKYAAAEKPAAVEVTAKEVAGNLAGRELMSTVRSLISCEVGRYDRDGSESCSAHICEASRLIAALCQDWGVDVYALDFEGMTPLFYCVVSGCLKCCAYLQELGLPLDSRDILGRSLIYCASCVGQAGGLKWLIEESIKGNMELTGERNESTKEKETELVAGTALLAEDKSAMDRTPLCKATWGDYPEVVSILLEYGCSPCTQDSKLRTPLHTALWGPAGGRSGVKIVGNVDACESIRCARLLLEHHEGDRAMNTFDIDGNAPIHIVASTNAVQGLLLLIEYGCDLNLRSKTQLEWNAVMCAAYRGHHQVVKLLIEKGADLEATDAFGRTALEYAIRGGSAHCLALLLDHMDLAPSLVNFLIHTAAINSQCSCLVLLLKKHADLLAAHKCQHAAEIAPADRYLLLPINEVPDKEGGKDNSAETRSMQAHYVTPIHSVLLGQKALPISLLYFRSSPFPPFPSSDDQTPEQPEPPSRVIGSIGYLTRVSVEAYSSANCDEVKGDNCDEANCGSTEGMIRMTGTKTAVLQLKKERFVDNQFPRLNLSAAMISCVSLLQWYVRPLYENISEHCIVDWRSLIEFVVSAVCSNIVWTARHTKSLLNGLHHDTKSNLTILDRLKTFQDFTVLTELSQTSREDEVNRACPFCRGNVGKQVLRLKGHDDFAQLYLHVTSWNSHVPHSAGEEHEVLSGEMESPDTDVGLESHRIEIESLPDESTTGRPISNDLLYPKRRLVDEEAATIDRSYTEIVMESGMDYGVNSWMLLRIICDSPLFSFEISKVKKNLYVSTKLVDLFLYQTLQFVYHLDATGRKSILQTMLQGLERMNKAEALAFKVLPNTASEGYPLVYRLLDQKAKLLSEAKVSSPSASSSASPLARSVGRYSDSTRVCARFPSFPSMLPFVEEGKPLEIHNYQTFNIFTRLDDKRDVEVATRLFLNAVDKGDIELVRLMKSYIVDRENEGKEDQQQWQELIKTGAVIASSKDFVDIASILDSTTKVYLPNVYWRHKLETDGLRPAAGSVSGSTTLSVTNASGSSYPTDRAPLLLDDPGKATLGSATVDLTMYDRCEELNWSVLSQRLLEMDANCNTFYQDILADKTRYIQQLVEEWEVRNDIEELNKLTPWSKIQLVDTTEAFELAVDVLTPKAPAFGAPPSRLNYIGVDLEFHDDFTSSIQMCNDEGCYVFDVLKLHGQMQASERFKSLFEDGRIVKVLFASSNDLLRLLCDFDIIVANLWDTHRVARFSAQQAKKALQSSTERCAPNQDAPDQETCAPDDETAGQDLQTCVLEKQTCVQGQDACIPVQTPPLSSHALEYVQRYEERVRCLVEADVGAAGLSKLVQWFEPGVAISKIYQRRDWRIRPLPAVMVSYAGKDAFAARLVFRRQLLDILLFNERHSHKLWELGVNMMMRALEVVRSRCMPRRLNYVLICQWPTEEVDAG
ncbi:ankyrin repeat protein [Gregarina niphandrodes]|uniref:Ankyrin repeat protein n=1 Tax=Gregarina niphandrodes TaxID=110365 RepID=A0A023BCT4_GRENI|nr:ankyrin repeat protein [Gregarina niphandrodes]EZG86204.1 ankyrin repeat protein [Gregarina niphandrodes]|eukprot:XP_011128772.1 ankyrin repeat protein [Gregarina niphandrodes]